MKMVSVLFVLTLVSVASPASAYIAYLTDNRSVSAFGQSCIEPSPGQIQCEPFESDSATPATPFGAFDASVSAADGSASQTSALDFLTGAWTATGSANSFSDVGFGEGTSTFEIEFDLTNPADINLSGFVEAEEFFGFGDGLARVRLSQGATTLYLAEVQVNADFGSELVDFQAILGPGSYTLEALADGFGGSHSSYDLGFTSTLVPEPGTAALTAAGLLALATLGRRAPSRAGARAS